MAIRSSLLHSDREWGLWMEDCALARANLVSGPRRGPKHLPCHLEAPIGGQNDTESPPVADRPASGRDGPAMCVGDYDGLAGTFLMACWYSAIKRRIRWMCWGSLARSKLAVVPAPPPRSPRAESLRA